MGYLVKPLSYLAEKAAGFSHSFQGKQDIGHCPALSCPVCPILPAGTVSPRLQCQGEMPHHFRVIDVHIEEAATSPKQVLETFSIVKSQRQEEFAIIPTPKLEHIRNYLGAVKLPCGDFSATGAERANTGF